MSEKKVTKTFVKKGDKIILKTIVPERELNSKDIIDAITNDRTNLDKSNEDLVKYDKNICNFKTNIEVTKENIKLIEENLNKTNKFEEWALMVQESKLKAVVAEVKDECLKKVTDAYKHDDLLTAEQNAAQKFAQYREYIARHEKVAEQISQKVYKEKLYKPGYLANPFEVQTGGTITTSRL